MKITIELEKEEIIEKGSLIAQLMGVNTTEVTVGGIVKGETPEAEEAPKKRTRKKKADKEEVEETPSKDDEETEEIKVTYDNLNEFAKKRIKELGSRDTVVKTINKYGDRLADVKKEDYPSLYKEIADLSKEEEL